MSDQYDAFFHMEGLGSLPPKLLLHLAAESRPDTAWDAALPGREPTLLVSNVARGVEIAEAHFAEIKGKRGHPPKKFVDVVYTGPPIFDGPDAWGRQREDLFFMHCLQHARSTGAHICVACIHRDENRPHLHVLVVPSFPEGYGISYLRSRYAREERVGSKKGVRWQLSRMQDVFYEEVSSKHGLGRGKKGSKRKQQKLTLAKRVEARLTASQEAAARAEAEKKAQEEAAAKAKKKAEEEAESLRILEIARNNSERQTEEARLRLVQAERDEEAGRRTLLGKLSARGRALREETEQARREREEESRARARLQADIKELAARAERDAREKDQAVKQLGKAETDIELLKGGYADLQRQASLIADQAAVDRANTESAQAAARRLHGQIQIERRRTEIYRGVLKRVREFLGMQPLSPSDEEWLETGKNAPAAVVGEMGQHLHKLHQSVRKEVMRKVVNMMKLTSASLPSELRPRFRDAAKTAWASVSKEEAKDAQEPDRRPGAGQGR